METILNRARLVIAAKSLMLIGMQKQFLFLLQSNTLVKYFVFGMSHTGQKLWRYCNAKIKMSALKFTEVLTIFFTEYQGVIV